MSFIETVLHPVIKTFKELETERGFDIPKILGACNSLRNLFAEWFDKEGSRLEDLPQEKKVELWEKSKEFCPDDRVNFCKAVVFYQSF